MLQGFFSGTTIQNRFSHCFFAISTLRDNINELMFTNEQNHQKNIIYRRNQKNCYDSRKNPTHNTEKTESPHVLVFIQLALI